MKRPNSIERYFKICSYLLMAEGFATLALTGNVDIPSILLYVIALVLSWQSDKPDSKLQISPKTANWLALSFIPFIYFDWRFISTTYTGPLIHYSLFISIFNLFKVKADRDWVFLYLIAIFEVLLAATLTIDFTFILMLILFVVIALATLEAFEVKRSGTEVFEPKDERLLSRLGQILPIRRIAYLVSITFVMVLLIGAIATPVFLLIPRFNSGFMAQSFGSSMVSLTGFSDIVELGDVGNIKKNEQVVMHVRVRSTDDNIKLAPKWRGITLSQYDGKTWREPRREQRKSLRLVDGQYKLAQRSNENPQIVEQTFYIEPLNTPVVFVANRPIAIGEQLPSLYKLQSDSLMTSDHSFKQITYSAFSDISQPGPALLNSDNTEYSDEIKDRYLQLPEMDNRIAELAREVTRNANSRLEKAQAIEKYLKGQFSYTLDLKRTAEADPIADFLFNIKAGHCEYFASSMVIMLRNIGVAARVVNGFQTGEFNEVGNVYTVRQSDAHSWVEVYFPNSDRWIEFDPTPSAGLSQYAGGILNQLKKYFDALRMIWIDYVVTYDEQRQSYLASAIQQSFVRYKIKLENLQLSLRQLLSNTFGQISSGKLMAQNALGFFVLIILLLGGFFAWRFHRLLTHWQLSPNKLFASWLGRLLVVPWLRWRTRDNPKQSAVLFYNEMLSSLNRWNLVKKPAQTPQEFATELEIPGVWTITNYYHRVRYQGTELAETDRQQIRELLVHLRKQGPVQEIDTKLIARQRYLVAASISGVLLISAFIGISVYNDRRFDRAAAMAQIHIKRFNDEVRPATPKDIDDILQQVRTESGNGGEYLAAALTDKEPLLMTPFSKIPWDDYFDVKTIPTQEILTNAFNRADVAKLEQAAIQQKFSFGGSLDYLKKYHSLEQIVERSPLIERTDLMLWKAYIYKRDGKESECRNELSLMISLGEHLTQDYNFAHTLLGYTIMARGSLAMAKYYQLNDQIDLARQWLSQAREYYRYRKQLEYVREQVHIAGGSEDSLEALIKMAQGKEHGLAQEAVIAIGKGWLANPKNVALGLPSVRETVLERFTVSSDNVIAKCAANSLLAAKEMGFSERFQHYKQSDARKLSR